MSAELEIPIGILCDLQGPKIRIGGFADDATIKLAIGDSYLLSSGIGTEEGNQEGVYLEQALLDDIHAGDTLLLDDGKVSLVVGEKGADYARCEVTRGGALSSRKGVNKFGGGLSASALTEKDKQDIATVAALDSDYVAISFVRSAEDVNETRQLLSAAGSRAHIIAKIERAEAITDEYLPGIIKAADGIMVARGDLGVEIGDENLMPVQKHLIGAAISANKVVITATQMMESMIHAATPTRAEVFDVANAVLDGTDAVMLSAETAVGSYPVETVEAMARVIMGAEMHPGTQSSEHRINQVFERIDESVAMAAMYVANHLSDVRAIICMTETGNTPLQMSRITSSLQIYAMASVIRTCSIAALYRGVVPVPFDTAGLEPEEVDAAAIDCLRKRSVVEEGDLVLITKGDFMNVHGGTNTLRIAQVGS